MMSLRWQIRRRPVPEDRCARLPGSLHPVLRRVYAARGIGPDELDLSLGGLLPVGGLAAALRAAELLAGAIERGERILVLGDYDADGATATALLISSLRALGHDNCAYLVPDRFRYGYGLSPEIAALAARGAPDWLLTVDNGISSVDGVARARSLGMRVIVTDHHLPGERLPEADAIVNPNLPDEPFAGKSLAGVGVAFYLLAALLRTLRERGRLTAAEERRIVNEGLDLVALGTVADLVPLDHNNRILVAAGLRRMRAGRLRPGLQALFTVAGRETARTAAADLGYAIAPRLNAAGRLTDMSLGIDCLLASDPVLARRLAERLDALNRERRRLQAEMEAEAGRQLDAAAAQLAVDDALGHCLFDPGWHEGVVGLLASRVKERTGRPVVAFARADDPQLLKGSARSVDGVHMRDLLDRVAVRHPGLLLRFGGHAMAAGLSLRAADLARFRAAFEAELAQHADALAGPGLLLSDGSLPADQLGPALAQTLADAGPWGQGCPAPLFDDRFEALDQRLLQARHLKLRLRHADGGEPVDAIAFGQSRLPGDGPLRVCYRLELNHYRGRAEAQLVVEHMQSD